MTDGPRELEIAGLGRVSINRAPASPIEVAMFLGSLTVELDGLVKELEVGDAAAVKAREHYIKAYAVAFRQSSGSMELRKQTAIETTHVQRLAAEEADSHVRDLRRKVDALKTRIDVGRSYGAAVRAEIELARSPFQVQP